ncbi:MAG: hypothetical protein KAS32_21390 [Candidatus Peribacteraceae bacterium]|nr:hypothetical protein [Candidatus Peribacteraceae bacterium]
MTISTTETTSNGHTTFKIDHALKYGVDGAIILNAIGLCILVQHSKGNLNPISGHHWARVSAEEMAQLIPYMKSRKIARIMYELENEGALKSNNYNTSTRDRTKWYTTSDFTVERFSNYCLDSLK